MRVDVLCVDKTGAIHSSLTWRQMLFVLTEDLVVSDGMMGTRVYVMQETGNRNKKISELSQRKIAEFAVNAAYECRYATMEAILSIL